jgi:hypothetical protein
LAVIVIPVIRASAGDFPATHKLIAAHDLLRTSDDPKDVQPVVGAVDDVRSARGYRSLAFFVWTARMQTTAAQGVGSDELHVMGGRPGTHNHKKGYSEYKSALSLD